MKVRIVQQPTGSHEGISLDLYGQGRVYDAPSSLATYLVVEGFAIVEMRSDDRRSTHTPVTPPETSLCMTEGCGSCAATFERRLGERGRIVESRRRATHRVWVSPGTEHRPLKPLRQRHLKMRRRLEFCLPTVRV